MKNLYIESSNGVSGDILLSGLALLGADLDAISTTLSKLLNEKVALSTETVIRKGIACEKLVIKCDPESNAPFRHYHTIEKLIDDSPISLDVKTKSKEAFLLIAKAESKMHNMTVKEVHFHEVGAVDTIIDIVGFGLAIEQLGIDKIYSSPVGLGSGDAIIAHGLVSLPAPATLEILKGAPVKRIDVNTELTTPTGAALLKTYVNVWSNSFSGTVTNQSFSTGTKEISETTNMARFIAFRSPKQQAKVEEIVLLETNIDDMSGENFGLALEKLMKKGAKDVYYTPIYMKKNRPAYILSVLCEKRLETHMINMIYKITTTAGIRRQAIKRYIAEREFVEIDIDGFKAKVKKLNLLGSVKYMPEWSSCEEIAEKLDKTALEVYCNIKATIDKGAKK